MRKTVFISYSHHDRKFVERLAKRLKKLEFDVWWDQWEIKVGDSIIQKVADGIKNSAFLVVVLSRNSVKSSWVQKELNTALGQQLAEKSITVLPILIDKFKPDQIPPLLSDIKRADFTTSYVKGFAEVIKALSDKSAISIPEYRLSWQERFSEALRDPIWQRIGALIGLVALLITIYSLRPSIASYFETPTVTASSLPVQTAPPIVTVPSQTNLSEVTEADITIHTVTEGLTVGYGKEQSIARDSQGNLHVFFETINHDFYHIKSDNNGSTWDTPTLLGSETKSIEASAVADSIGRVHLIWGRWDGGTLYYNLYENGTWSQPESLLSGAFGRDIGIDSFNNPHLVVSSADVYHIHLLQNQWLSEIASSGSWHADVVADQNDNISIVYNSGFTYPEPSTSVYYQQFDGKRWNQSVKLSKSPFWSGAAAITIDNNNIYHVVWFGTKSQSGGNDTLYYSRHIEGEWQTPLPIGEVGYSAGQTGKESPSIASDKNGIVFVAWKGKNENNKWVLFLRAFTNGWTKIIQINEADSIGVSWPSLSYQQGSGDGVDLVWTANETGKSTVKYAHIDVLDFFPESQPTTTAP